MTRNQRYSQTRAQVSSVSAGELPMTVTGKPLKFLMREAMIGELGLVEAKTA